MFIIFLLFISCFFSCGIFLPVKTNSVIKEEKYITKIIEKEISDAMKMNAVSQTSTGICIYSVRLNKVIYQMNADKLFYPASNIKLFTSALALEKLGKDFMYHTKVVSDVGPDEEGNIDGNLYYVGSGDPTITMDDLEKIAREFKNRGVKKIKGALCGDETYLDTVRQGMGWMWDDAPQWFCPELSAISLNDNCVTFTISPAEKIGEPLRVVKISPFDKIIKIENQSETSPERTINTAEIGRDPVKNDNTFYLKGKMSIKSRPQKITCTIHNPILFVLSALRDFLENKEITVDGEIRAEKAPENSFLIAEHFSPPLSEILKLFNKPSNNYVGEMLLKTVGAEVRGVPGSAEKGCAEDENFLASIGIPRKTYRLVDGSGVSRYDLVTPIQIVTLLKEMYSRETFEIFKDSLPIAGKDGTLKYRMRGSPAEGITYAKTGTATGISALSGYIFHKSGEIFIFSIIMNGYIGDDDPRRLVQDKICNSIAELKIK